MEYSMLIDGRSVTTAEQDDVINPARGEPFATVPARHEGARRRGRRRRRARLQDLAQGRGACAAQKLNECAAAIQGRVQDIATVLSQEQGKPLTAAMGEVFGASMWFSYYANLADRARGAAGRRREAHRGRAQAARRRGRDHAVELPGDPAGVEARAGVARRQHGGREAVAVHAAHLAHGGRHPEGRPAAGRAERARRAATSSARTLGEHPGVRKISFTGSVATGKKIMGYAADDLKRVTLELGGNDPAIVLDDVDPNAVADGLFWGAFQNSGQVCTAIKRLYVHEKVYEPIVDGPHRAREDGARSGDGLDPETQLGPINNKMQLERVMGLVDDAQEERRHDRGRRRAARRLRLLLSADDRHRRRRGHAPGRRGAVRHRAAGHQVLATSTTRSSRPTARTTGSAARSGPATSTRGEELVQELESRHRLGEPAHGHHAVRAVRRRQVERHRLRERPLGLRGVHRDAGGEHEEGVSALSS